MPTKQISSLQVHPDNTANLLISSLCPSLIIASHTVCNLGVTLDSNFNFIKHISLACHCFFYHIHDLHCIHHYISLSVAKTIATALITSRLDYCNSLLYNTSRLTIIQNFSVFRTAQLGLSFWFSHSVPLLKSLHQLPVQSPIIFKLCTIAYQTLFSGESSYIFSMLSLAPKPRKVCSSGFQLLSVPRVKTHAGWHSCFFNCYPYTLESTL